MIYIGIDPGKNGGIAYIQDTDISKVLLKNTLMNTIIFDENTMITLLRRFNPSNCVAYVEHVHAMPNQGVSSTFNFGMNFGFIQGVLKAYGIPYELVTPQKWKKEFSCTSDKNTSIEVCKRLFPSVNLKATDRCTKDHDGMAEALLIAEYGRRHYNGKS